MNIEEECNKIIACSSNTNTNNDLKLVMEERTEHRKSRLDCLMLIIERAYRRKHGLTQKQLGELVRLANEFNNILKQK